MLMERLDTGYVYEEVKRCADDCSGETFCYYISLCFFPHLQSDSAGDSWAVLITGTRAGEIGLSQNSGVLPQNPNFEQQ